MNKNTSSKTKLIIYLVSVALLIIALLVAMTVITLNYTNADTILPGVSIAGIDVSGLTVDQAQELIKKQINENSDSTIKITAGSDSVDVTFSDLGASFNPLLSAEEAYSYGHSGFFSSIGPSVKAFLGNNKDFDLSLYINNRIFDSTMSDFTDYDKSVQASYEFIEGSIRVTNGKSAYTINPITVKEAVTESLGQLDFSPLSFTKENISPIPFDIADIIENHSSEAVSATYYRDTDGSIKVTEGSDKVTVDASEAKKIISSHTNPGETFDIPAQIDFAKYTQDELYEALFRDVLGSHTTSYASSNANRSHNVALAAKSINEKILLPGESLSYNQTLGKRTPEAGYKMAGAYSNGETIQAYGGGICQVSSTLYVAALKSNLKIEDRTCHMFTVGYVPLGLDATVDYGTVDFVFSNDTDFPIKISSYTTSGKQVVCEIIGTKTENFNVTFETTGVSSIPYSTEIEKDPTMPEGTEQIVKKGSNGIRCTTYRVVSVDGEVVSRTLEAQSYYLPHNELKKVGTMPVDSEAAVSPEITEPNGSETIPEVAPEATPEAPVVTTPPADVVPEAPVVTTPPADVAPEVPATPPTTEAPTVSEI